jgi:hypothetical protein
VNRRNRVQNAQSGKRTDEVKVPVRPGFDPRLAGLVLGTLDQISAVVGSAISGVPYAAMRTSAGFSEEDESELRGALEAVAWKHSTSFAEHKPLIEMLVGLTALQAAKADSVLMQKGDAQPLSSREMFGILFMIFAPLLLIGLICMFASQKGEK